MFEKLNKFINENLQKINIPMHEGVDYGIKNITNEIKNGFEELKEKMKTPLWDINRKVVIGCYKGIDKKGVKELKKNLEKKNGPKVPQGYIDFLQNYNAMNVLMSFVIFGHLKKGLSIYFRSLGSYPKYIRKDCLNIGSYNPDKSPIFINQQGNILVFSGTWMFDRKHEGLEDEAKDALIGYWDNIEDFIAEETERYYNLFIEKPFAFPTKEMLPNNVTPEIFERLVKEEKIHFRGDL